MMRNLLIVLCIYFTFSAAQKNYKGYKLVSVTPETDAQFEYLVKLQLSSSVQFWHDLKRDGDAEIMVSPEEYEDLVDQLLSHDMIPTVKIRNIQSYLDKQKQYHEKRMEERENEEFPIDVFHTYDEIASWLTDLAANSEIVTLGSIGKSYEGREQLYVTITEGVPGNKPVNWIDCGIHASEWIGHAACVWYINELVTKFNKDDEITRIINEYDWIILPVLNPDGYVWAHSETGDRMWRKTRKPNEGSECIGTDPNRNYDNHWGGAGSSDDPCSWSYHGPSAFSEQEISNHRDKMLELKDRLNMMYMMHSAGQVWTLPYGWTKDFPADYDEMARVSSLAVEAATQTHQVPWSYGSCSHSFFLASGLAIDWVYDTVGLIYSFILEMRPDHEELIIDEDQIIPNSEETWAGIVAALKAIESKGK